MRTQYQTIMSLDIAGFKRVLKAHVAVSSETFIVAYVTRSFSVYRCWPILIKLHKSVFECDIQVCCDIVVLWNTNYN